MKKKHLLFGFSFFLLLLLFSMFAVLMPPKKPPKKFPETFEIDETFEGKEISEEKEVFVSMKRMLFIGDSRTVGLAEYSNLEYADFFAKIGMTVWHVFDTQISVPTVGKITLAQLIKSKTYDIIYIMLGINELGYSFEKIAKQYQIVVDLIRKEQPDAKIILLGNLHVTKARSESDKNINNLAINRFNTVIAQKADNQSIFYLDVNPIFDDESGNLDKEKSIDSAHLQAKYYREWSNWLIIQTKEILEQ